MPRLPCFAILLAAFAMLPGTALARRSMQFTVTNVRETSGTIHLEICPERLWLKKCPIVTEVAARQGVTVVTLANVPPGRYAVFAYHDRNRNGKADRNFIGMPTEDVGFSNNALKRLAKPRFSDAAFDHGDDDQQFTFRMKHF